MKLYLAVGLLFFLQSSVFSQIINPVTDYVKMQHLKADDIIFKWTADMKGDGRNVVFLSLRREFQSDTKAERVPSWFVYLTKPDGSYVLAAGEDDDGIVGLSPIASIDPRQMYVGKIARLNRRGIVVAQTYYPRKADSVRYVYAYTIEGDRLKRTLLVKYDPDGPDNAVYDQYLSEGNRTKVEPQEIHP